MDHPLPLSAAPDDVHSPSGPHACPRCRSAPAGVPPLRSSLFGGPARRCLRCGAAWTVSGGVTRLLGCCRGCGIPLADAGRGEPAERCAECGGAAAVRERPEEGIAAATLNEIELGLARRLSFVTARGVDGYLGRVARRVASAVHGGPTPRRVVVLDDPRLRSLALPDGTLVLSTGQLFVLDDEAELAFVLGRELAHLASGAAARSLLRIGMASMARNSGTEAHVWGEAALDVLRLGRGTDAELEADRVAFQALGRLGYDPRSAVAGIERLGEAIERGDERCGDVAFALPPPAERLRALERLRPSLPADAPVGRTNREPFRRVVRRGEGEYEPVEGFLALDIRPASAPLPSRRWSPALVVAGAVTLVVALAALAFWLAG